jgi:hypothetical protein
MSENMQLGGFEGVPLFLQSTSNLPSVVALCETPALNHHDLTVRLKPHADFVSSVRSSGFAPRKHIDNLSVPNYAGEGAKSHNIAHSHCLNHSTPTEIQCNDATSRRSEFKL